MTKIDGIELREDLITCIYDDGTEKRFQLDVFKECADNIIRAWKEKKGMKYHDLMSSPLMKMYVGEELVIYKTE